MQTTTKKTTQNTAVFSVRPRSASWQDRREFVGIEAAVEAIVEIKLTGEDVEIMERTSEEGYSYRNARIRKIEREAAHRLAARDAGTPAETGFVSETGRVAVNGVVVGYVYDRQHARKSTEHVFVAADGTEVELGNVEGKLGQSWADALGEAAIAVAEELAPEGADEQRVEAAPAEDNKVEVGKRNRYHYCNDWDPEYFKAMAKECRDRAHKSFENSDTDGFMSQWANEEMARRYDHAAAIARDGHMMGKRVVLDLDGNIISDDERKHEYYGYYWFIPSREGKDRFFNESQAFNDKTALRNNAKKGCVMGYAMHHVTMNNSGDVEYGEFAYLDEETMDALQAARDAVA